MYGIWSTGWPRVASRLQECRIPTKFDMSGAVEIPQSINMAMPTHLNCTEFVYFGSKMTSWRNP